MAVTVLQQESSPGSRGPAVVAGSRKAQPLSDADEAEVLEFLSARPIHTVFMASLIRDNGMVSSFNRGSFFGCRSENDCLEGVALVGHATIVETESEECIKAFAHLAKNHSPAHLIRGEKEKVASFWSYYAERDRTPRLLSGELLLELKTIPTAFEPVSGLRQATTSDLDMIIEVNASMASAESGVNPLARDPNGFRERARRRISKGRIWIWSENSRLIFKTDIIAETPEAIYLEGVYVDPQHRGKGYGLRCLSQLTGQLLTRTTSVCLTVIEKSSSTLNFYRRVGFEPASRYDTFYLQR